MAFRRDKERSLAWRRFTDRHADALVRCGVPPMLLEEELRWRYFVGHAYWSPDGRPPASFSVDDLSDAQACNLLRLMEGIEPASDLCVTLRTRVSRR